MGRKVAVAKRIGREISIVHAFCANTGAFSDDEEDETAELLRELEKIKRERAEQKEKEVGQQRVSVARAGFANPVNLGAGKGCRGARPKGKRHRSRQSSPHTFEGC